MYLNPGYMDFISNIPRGIQCIEGKIEIGWVCTDCKLFHEHTRKSKGDEVRTPGYCGVGNGEQWEHVLVLSDADARQYLKDVESEVDVDGGRGEGMGEGKGKGKQVSFED